MRPQRPPAGRRRSVTESDIPEKDSILVVEDDPFISRLLALELSGEGYEVRAAGDGQEALELAFEYPPDLVLADVMMPRMDGFELTRRLREDPRTESVTIIMLTARGLSADKLQGLASGADDYIVKPFENEEVIARVRGALRRASYMKAQSPLTGLPGNVRIEDEIQARIDAGEEFSLMYLDLDNFKSFSDRYGFVRGDQTLKAIGDLIRDAARMVGGPGTFIGHIGGDDYVVMTTPELAVPIAGEVIGRLDEAVPRFYDPEDARRGWVESVDRKGRPDKFPLLTISIGIASSGVRRFTHRAEAVAVATELKNHAKRTAGSSVEVDRRIEPPGL
jgi:DNA-binding response OmpR family regulator